LESLKEKRKRIRQEKIFAEIMAGNFPESMKSSTNRSKNAVEPQAG